MYSILTTVMLVVVLPNQGVGYSVMELKTWNITGKHIAIPEVNSLTSVDAIIPFEYYSLQYCRADQLERDSSKVNVGMMLKGDLLESSLYEFNIMKNESCKKLTCSPGEDILSAASIRKFNEFIRRGYRTNMVLDNLPLIASDAARGMAIKKFCKDDRNPLRSAPEVRGASIGGCEDDKVFLHNHHDFSIHYNYISNDSIIIVGFEVFPRSIRKPDCSKNTGRLFVDSNTTSSKQIHWTYSVSWIEKPASAWGTRWDYYLQNTGAASEAAPHWRLITQSLLVLLCLSSMVILILMRTLRRDIDRYHEDGEDQDVTGWKWIAGDVFRPPPHPELFAGIIGTGAQLVGMGGTVLSAAMFGFLSPSYRGAVVTTTISLFVAMSILNGYTTGRFLALFHCKSWPTVVKSATVFPGFCFVIWGFCEILLSVHGASNAVTLKVAFVILLSWFGTSIPLAFFGAAYAFRRPVEIPLRFNELERRIPSRKWIFHIIPTIFLPGLVPYAAAHVEIRLLMRAIWQGQVYYVFGFLSLVFAVVIVTVALTVVVYIYHLLLNEDHQWWWRSMFASSGMGIYYLAYCVSYYCTVLKVSSWTGFIVYCSFCLVSALSLTILVAICGFFASWMFIVSIYSYIKID